MGHAAIRVKDLEASFRFYCDLLGLEKNWAGDADWANLKLGPDDLSLVREQGAKHPPHLGLKVASEEDLQKAHDKLMAAGVRPGPIKKHRDGTSSFYFKDPDGNILEGLWDPNDS